MTGKKQKWGLNMKINSELKNGKISFSKGKGAFTIKIGEVFKSDKSKQSSLKEWFEKLNNIFLFTISSFLIVGCGTDNVLNIDTTKPEPTPFRLYMEYEQDESGYYHKTYPSGSASSYGRVYVDTLPTQRVFWSSPNTFDTYYQQQWFSTPIIQYSTMSSGCYRSSTTTIISHRSYCFTSLHVIPIHRVV